MAKGEDTTRHCLVDVYGKVAKRMSNVLAFICNTDVVPIIRVQKQTMDKSMRSDWVFYSNVLAP